MALKSLLEAKHFRTRSGCRLGSSGIEFEMLVQPEARGEYLVVLAADLSESKRQRLLRRGATRCVVHPKNLSAPELLKLMDAQQDGQGFTLDTGMGANYSSSWACREDDMGLHEGQTLAMVAFDGQSPVGFSTFGLSLNNWDDEPDAYRLRFSGEMTFVGRDHRGQGFGIDLAVACSAVACDVAEACYRALPSGKSFNAIVAADIDSEGGERFTDYVYAELLSTFAELRGNKGVSVGRVELDAGW